MSDYDAYSHYYDLRATGLPGDVEFYVAEARETGGPVLELGCGTGRTLIPIAAAGFEIVGLDLSPHMLRVAREKVALLDADVQERITLLEGDMRDFHLGREFSLVTIPYRAFLHLLTPDDERATLRRIHAHLAPGGRLALNIFDPHLGMIVAHTGPTGSALKNYDEFTHPETGHRHVVWDTRQYDLETQQVEQTFIIEEIDKRGKAIDKTYTGFTLRYLFRWEMAYLLELCGFHVVSLHGDFGGGPCKPGGEQVWRAEKA